MRWSTTRVPRCGASLSVIGLISKEPLPSEDQRQASLLPACRLITSTLAATMKAE